MEEEISAEMLKKSRQLCQDFLGGAWSRINLETGDGFHMEPISGGMSNKLYLCSLCDKIPTTGNEPRKVVLRMYGLILSDFGTIVNDSVVAALLAERNLGPKLYGIFNEGRIEEYIESKTLICKDIQQPRISAAIARTMASIHGMQVPLSKEPVWIFEKINGFMEQALDNGPLPLKRPEHKEYIQRISSIDFKSEIAYLRETLAEVDSPVVFAHNDLQEGNILLSAVKRKITLGGDVKCLSNGTDPALLDDFKLTAIDYEYSSYNYRGFDIGSHFCEWCYDYNAAEYPHFTARLEDYPSVEEQLRFIHAYLKSSKMDTMDVEAEAEQMLKEVDRFRLASHLLWALWALLSVKISEIEFGYMEYAMARFDGYFKHKERLRAKNVKEP